MTAREQIISLHRVQELALQTQAAEKVLHDAPIRIEEIEGHFRERNAEYVAVKDRFDELEADQRLRTTELKSLEENREKFMEDLMQVKNQREYAAMLKEIDSVKAHIAEHEDAIISDMEEIEKLKEELKSHEEHIAKEREAVDRERSEVEAAEAKARKTIEKLNKERESIESDLPRDLSAPIHKLEARRQGIFLSKVENGTCQACFVRVRPQVFQEIKMASKVHTCSNCRRFLYHERSIKPKPEASNLADGVEAVNGGSV